MLVIENQWHFFYYYSLQSHSKVKYLPKIRPSHFLGGKSQEELLRSCLYSIKILLKEQWNKLGAQKHMNTTVMDDGLLIIIGENELYKKPLKVDIYKSLIENLYDFCRITTKSYFNMEKVKHKLSSEYERLLISPPAIKKITRSMLPRDIRERGEAMLASLDEEIKVNKAKLEEPITIDRLIDKLQTQRLQVQGKVGVEDKEFYADWVDSDKKALEESNILRSLDLQKQYKNNIINIGNDRYLHKNIDTVNREYEYEANEGTQKKNISFHEMEDKELGLPEFQLLPLDWRKVYPYYMNPQSLTVRRYLTDSNKLRSQYNNEREKLTYTQNPSLIRKEELRIRDPTKLVPLDVVFELPSKFVGGKPNFTEVSTIVPSGYDAIGQLATPIRHYKQVDELQNLQAYKFYRNFEDMGNSISELKIPSEYITDKPTYYVNARGLKKLYVEPSIKDIISDRRKENLLKLSLDELENDDMDFQLRKFRDNLDEKRRMRKFRPYELIEIRNKSENYLISKAYEQYLFRVPSTKVIPPMEFAPLSSLINNTALGGKRLPPIKESEHKFKRKKFIRDLEVSEEDTDSKDTVERHRLVHFDDAAISMDNRKSKKKYYSPPPLN
ncbi:uncharacterized protein CMU_038010 [Cryptosporidium muris RN66]|uniref:Uncharacterized protein n=1 Tax=Cryptosporidium muris (strain RN66) TaxID=441375 RepID=B6A945_CRYMR|nr:uncharacterized protein CMU_038010 [Cryptosporidium muris RN66]EEA04736.1 hypothetical protein, conserved [Cryptosporidium muris RN66]|eukprot:XP_002139085.1 hypothetical protein [Cryptosporidium muris RN66]